MAATPFRVKAVYHYKIPPGNFGTQQSAPFPGFIFPISGCAEIHFQDTPYFISKGNVLHGSANSKMYKRVAGNKEWQYICVLYETYDEPKNLDLSKLHFSLALCESPLMQELLFQLSMAYKCPDCISSFQVETLFRRILEETFLCARNQVQYGAKELFESVSEYIHNNYMDDLTVGILSQRSNVNENRLFYVFQKYVGMGPGAYLRTYRLNRAKEMLVTSQAPVGMVAKQVGYHDSLNFSRIFKKHFGVSPSKLRENQ